MAVMFGVTNPAVRGADYYEAMLDSMYLAVCTVDGVGGLDTSLYRTADSDRWTRARSREPGREVGHLEVAFELGEVLEFGRSHILQRAGAHFVHRYNLDDDAKSQSCLAAATRALIEACAAWSFPDGSRTQSVGPSEQLALGNGPEWVLTSIFFTIRLPRG